MNIYFGDVKISEVCDFRVEIDGKLVYFAEVDGKLGVSSKQGTKLFLVAGRYFDLSIIEEEE